MTKTTGGLSGLCLGVLALGVCGSAAETRSVWDGVYTSEQAARGAVVYERVCAECHGPDLGGGDMAPSLAGVEFLYNWHGLTAGDLLERLRVSMPPGQPTSVGRQEKADILAWVLEVNGFPAGDTELATRPAALAGISVLAEQPD